MTKRRASCSCGQLHLTVEGEPIRVSICHCLNCQQRTGSVFAAQVRFHRDHVEGPHGRATTYARTGDSGNACTFGFCPNCGTTVYWRVPPDHIYVALGAFADPSLPWQPKYSVYEERAFAWSNPLKGAAGVEHV
jgi:hypothetical protein